MSDHDSRPWAALRDEENDGHWADFGAWERWLKAEIERRAGNVPFDPHWLDDMDPTVSTHLYCLMCDQAESRAATVGQEAGR